MPITGTPLSTLSTDTSAGAGDAGKIVLLDGTGKVDATMLPTPATGDITSVTAGTGLSGGGTSGAVTLDVTIPVPTGGSTGQALVKNSGTSGDIGWGTVSGGSAEVVNVIYFLNVGTMTNATGAIGDIAIVGGSPQGLWYKDAANTWQYGGPVSGTGGTITGVTAGAGLAGGGTSGTVTLDVSFGTPTGLTVGGSNGAGAASSTVRSDHTHSLPAFGSTAGTFMEGNATPTASGLKTATTTVVVSAATAPSSGQVLQASDSTTASWVTPASASTTVKKAGTTIGTRGAVNLIEGSNVTITAADNSGADRVDITIASSGGGSGSGNPYIDAPASPHADDDEFTAFSGWTVWDSTANAVLTDDGDGSIDPWTFPASGHFRRKTVGSHLLVQLPKSSNSVYLYKAITPASNMLLWSRWAYFTENNSTGPTSYGAFGAMSDSGGRPSTGMLIEIANIGSVGRKVVSNLAGTRTYASVQAQGVLPPSITGLFAASSTSCKAFALSDFGDLQFDSGSPNTTSITYAYVGWRFQGHGSPGNVNGMCPILSIDYVRRKDSATAWVI